MLKDSLRLGLLLGFLAPLVGMLIYYFSKFSAVASFKEFFTFILVQPALLTAIVSICLVANAALFTLYVNKRKDRTAKGIFIATCIYGVASLLWKFVL